VGIDGGVVEAAMDVLFAEVAVGIGEHVLDEVDGEDEVVEASPATAHQGLRGCAASSATGERMVSSWRPHDRRATTFKRLESNWSGAKWSAHLGRKLKTKKKR